MKNFTILVDMDDVLVNTVQAWIEWLNTTYDLDVKYEDIKVWEMQVAFPSLTLDQIRYPLMQPSFWDAVEPKCGAIDGLKKLINDGHKVLVCSASHPYTITSKIKNCLFKHFDYLKTEQLIFTYDKKLINADFLIDDGVHNLIGASYKKILMNAPYNESFKETKYEKDLIRVRGWDEICDVIEEFSNESF